MKRAIDIEQLLVWAFVEELPKRNLSSAEANWDNISRFGGMGGVAIGESNTPQRYAAVSAPHPDAVIIGHQVDGLAELMGGSNGMVSIDYRGSRPMLFGDMAGPPGLPLQLRPFNVVALVKSMAVLRKRPVWYVGKVRLTRSIAANGRGLFIGQMLRKGRYSTGSFCPIGYSPSLLQIAEARAEYLLWHRALVELRSALADSLLAHAPQFPEAPQTPWIEDPAQAGVRKPKVLITPQVIAAIHEGRKKRRRRAV
jgi:hypothetical protein